MKSVSFYLLITMLTICSCRKKDTQIAAPSNTTGGTCLPTKLVGNNGFYSVYEFNGSRPVKETDYSPTGKLRYYTVATYDQNQELVKSITYDSTNNVIDSSIGVYDKEGLLIQVLGYHKFTMMIMDSKALLFYTKDKRLSSMLSWSDYNDGAGLIFRDSSVFVCDNNGNISREENYDTSRHLTYVWTMEYDNKPSLNKVLHMRPSPFYNNPNNTIRTTISSSQTTSSQQNSYEYNSQGQVTKEIMDDPKYFTNVYYTCK